MKLFTLLVGTSALFVAGCAAFFSVRGIGLLFAGSMIPVIIMASSLELAKLVGASFLYRTWKDITLLMKVYMTFGVILLVGITSMGIYGYLSDAFEDTKSRVYVYESNIVQLEKENKYLEDEIVKVESSANTVDDKAQKSEASFQKIYDDFIARQEVRRARLMGRMTELDAAVAAVGSKPGGLFSSKKKKLAEIQVLQQEERTDLRAQLKEMDAEAGKEYKLFLGKIDNLRQTTQEVDVQPRVQELYVKIKTNNESVLSLKQDIQNTDIGSFKFIARTFNTELEQAVKWFIIVIVIVFDPMAVTLVIAYNVLLLGTNSSSKKKLINNAAKEEVESKIETIPEEVKKEAEHGTTIQVLQNDEELHPKESQEVVKEIVDKQKAAAHTAQSTLEKKPKSSAGVTLPISDLDKVKIHQALKTVFKESPLLRRYYSIDELTKYMETLYASKKTSK
jgi:hypothetical protein